jgi:Kdo2-lipid IVA lauroyltransferase/acyltransferase
MAALFLLSRAVGLLPWRWLRVPGALLGVLAGSILRIRRRQVEGAMRRAGIDLVPETARRMYGSLGTALFEFLWMVGRRVSPVFAVRLTDRAQIALGRRSRERPVGLPTGRSGELPAGFPAGRGLVIATAHTGNWDLVACAASQGHMPLTVLTKRLRVQWLDRLWQSERASRSIELLDGEGVFGRAIDSIARGRDVAMMIDQAPERTSAVTEAPFLGEKARCDMMAALLAARTGVNLVLALACRHADGMYVVDVPLVLEPPARATRAWAEQATRVLNAELERFVRANPSQWLWLHRRWKPLSATALSAAQVVLSLEP